MRGKKEGIATRDMLASPKGGGEDRTRKREGQDGDYIPCETSCPPLGCRAFFHQGMYHLQWTYKKDFVRFVELRSWKVLRIIDCRDSTNLGKRM